MLASSATELPRHAILAVRDSKLNEEATMNIAAIIRNALADTAERTAMHRQRMTILQVMIGNPLMGAIFGLGSNAAAWVDLFHANTF